MTLESKELVQESWDSLLAAAPRVAERFFDRLLDLDPQLGRLFRATDLREHGRRFTRELTRIVRGLGEEWAAPADAPPPADGWADRRQALVGEALLWALEGVLGEAFTAPVRGAWRELYAAHAPAIRFAALGETGSSRVVPLARRRLVEIGS